MEKQREQEKKIEESQTEEVEEVEDEEEMPEITGEEKTTSTEQQKKNDKIISFSEGSDPSAIEKKKERAKVPRDCERGNGPVVGQRLPSLSKLSHRDLVFR